MCGFYSVLSAWRIGWTPSRWVLIELEIHGKMSMLLVTKTALYVFNAVCQLLTSKVR